MTNKNKKIILKEEMIKDLGELKEQFIKRLKNGEIEIKKEFFKKIPLGILKEGKVEKLEKLELNTKKILIILESPHRFEYKMNGEEIEAIGPAQGVTGKNICGKKKEIIEEVKTLSNGKESSENYEIILINPVPYQTSLFHLFKNTKKLNKNIKKLIWNFMWDSNFNKCKNEFVENIKKINPVCVFNCCTKEFKNEINKELKNSELKNIRELPHPSSKWFNKAI